MTCFTQIWRYSSQFLTCLGQILSSLCLGLTSSDQFWVVLWQILTCLSQVLRIYVSSWQVQSSFSSFYMFYSDFIKFLSIIDALLRVYDSVSASFCPFQSTIDDIIESLDTFSLISKIFRPVFPSFRGLQQVFWRYSDRSWVVCEFSYWFDRVFDKFQPDIVVF